MKKLFSISLLLAAAFLMNSCTKVEGEGGTSTIKGKLIINNYNVGGTILEGTYAGADEDVYIVYGDGKTFPGNDVKTSYDGTFEFNYLQNGKYTIYMYEDVLPEPTNAAKQQVVILTAEITKKKSTVDLGEITIKRK
jgi:hypothetical protein